ncbi:NUDIX domain-containing protein [Ideonella livida]|uniref:GDP-mannose pyrophosphatase n=1 Tax=Ideonella livida TaxID=2707176 RepID=A0A7C9PGL6_9BURK|nr:NUDIX hydrolase [Ideonella livida]NDY91437.1 NUDIX hydrolase [Ideonella livida]
MHPQAEGWSSGLTETKVEGREAFRGRLLQLKVDTVRLPDGAQSTREFVVHNGAAIVVPLLPDGRVVVEHQHRYPVGQVLCEFPAGKRDGEEPTWRCAWRELREETGYVAAELAFATRMFNAPAYSTEFIDLWFARGLTPGPAALDAGEWLEVSAMSVQELESLSWRGELPDAKTLVAMHYLRAMLDGRWTPVWRSVADWGAEGTV